MSNKKYEVFISYRRKGGYDTAKLIYDRLRIDGYSVSFDIDTLVNGNFDIELEQRVNECKDFLLVLSPGVFDRFFSDNPDYDPEDDWVRREIVCALKANKNIIPLALDGFVFPKAMPSDVNVKSIYKKNAIDLYPKYFEAAYAKMKTFMVSKPRWAVRHKKKLISAAAVSILAAASLLIVQKNQEMEIAKAAAAEEEKKRTLDSIQKAREQYMEQRKQGRTCHWNGSSDGISQIILEKISEAGIQKTPCSGRGIIATPSKPNCRETEQAKIACYYSPRITFQTCDSKPFTFLEKSERLKSAPRETEQAAMEEIAGELRKTDFSDWVAAIKDF